MRKHVTITVEPESVPYKEMGRSRVMEAPHVAKSPLQLLRQRQLALHLEAPVQDLGAVVRLSAAGIDGVIALSDNRNSRIGHHAQIARTQLEAHLLRCAGLEVNPLEGSQRPQRRARHVGKFEVKLGLVGPVSPL